MDPRSSTLSPARALEENAPAVLEDTAVDLPQSAVQPESAKLQQPKPQRKSSVPSEEEDRKSIIPFTKVQKIIKADKVCSSV
jgi:hypothetical protein